MVYLDLLHTEIRGVPLFFLLLFSVSVFAGEIDTNEFKIKDSPPWLTRSRVERISNRIQTKLEWVTRKTPVYFYATPEAYNKAQGLGPLSLAVTVSRDNSSAIHIGPSVDNKNFDEVFAHEIVHVISFQKYKGSIPRWLEEGLANHLAKAEKPNYKWLSKQPFPADVTELAHPFKGALSQIVYRYKASQALAEMLDKKCKLERLIQLSVERDMNDYIKTYCEIPDLNQAFKDWVKKQAG